MGPFENALLGVIFLGMGAFATFLMYRLWGYPFDHATLKSEAPPRLMRLHRTLGWVFVAVYAYLMIQMVPRLWSYQIELPPRTVAHLMLGMAIGAILVTKIAIVRFYKHLEGTLAPALGTAVLVATVVLIGLSAPIAVREALASSQDLIEPANLERVKAQLETAGLQDPAQRAALASAKGLIAGRNVMADRCVTCHDLRTVLARPRTPEDWRDTVRRMADRSARITPIREPDQWEVTAYLIAISPDLQASAKERLDQEQAKQKSEAAAGQLAGPGGPYNAAEAERVFEKKCSQCHPAAMVDRAKLSTPEDVRRLVVRMVRNGMAVSPHEMEQITRYLTETKVR